MKTTNHNNPSKRHGKRRLKFHWKIIFSIAGVIILTAIVVKVITPDTVEIPVESDSLQPVYVTKTLPYEDNSSKSNQDSLYTQLKEKDEEDWQKQKDAFDSFDWSKVENIGKYTKPLNASSQLSEEDIDLLTQLVLSEASIFKGTPDCDKIMQYVAATAYNRIGHDGFGPNFTFADSLTTVISNPSQYKDVINDLYKLDAHDEVARKNVLEVVNGTAHTPENLYFEDCSDIYYIDFDAEESYVDGDGDLIWTYEAAKEDAEKEFKSHYSQAEEFTVVYSALSSEGRFLMFGTNPYGAYATDPNPKGAN